MKNFTTLFLLTLLFLFTNARFELAIVKYQPHQVQEKQGIKVSNSLKITKLHSITTKTGSKINFLTDENNLYITSCTPQCININELKPIELTPNGSKILVNRNNSLPKGYTPQNLIQIKDKKVKLQYSDLKLIQKTTDSLYSLIDGAKKSNVKGFIINSAYRSESLQREIFNSNLKLFRKTSKTYKEAYEKTRQLVALPGNSEHHTGLALDIFSINGHHRNDFVGTKEQIWLEKNSYKYGFIVRYAKDKTKETNSNYEPWHIRYVGIPLSSYLYHKNLCLEEFYEKIFAGVILEDNNYLFMQIKDIQKVYIDKTMKSKTQLETVIKGTMLLTFKKD